MKSERFNTPGSLRLYGILSAMAGILLAFTGNMQAQTHYTSRVSFGVKGGVDFSQVSFTPSTRETMKPGGVAGLTFRYIEESHFGLVAELNWEQRGWKENFDGAPYYYSRTINYIQIPVLAHIYFGSRGHFFFNAGPEIGFVVGSGEKANFDIDKIGSLPDWPDKKVNVEQMRLPVSQKIDFGISAGLGGEFFVTSRHSMYVEARFYYGLGNVLKSGRTEPVRGSNSMSIMATAGYWFRIK